MLLIQPGTFYISNVVFVPGFFCGILQVHFDSLWIKEGEEIMATHVPFRDALRKKKDQTWIEWLIILHDRPFMQLICIPLFLLLLAPLYALPNAVPLVLAMICTLVIHELGHALMFSLCGVEYQFMLLFPLGLSIRQLDERKKNGQVVTCYEQALTYVAGPLMNLLCMSLALWGVLSFPAFIQVGKALIIFNGFFCLANLLPFPMLDGGETFDIIVSSLYKKHMWHLPFALGVLLCSLVSVVAMVIPLQNAFLMLMHGMFVVGWIIYGLLLWKLRSKQLSYCVDAVVPLLLNSAQICVLILLYTCMIIFTFIIFDHPQLCMSC
jgi:Zn-dependent protease